MEILGVGPSELVFIIIIALIVLGPKDMQKAGRTIGKFLRDIALSPIWLAFKNITSELRTLPNKLMREANPDLYSDQSNSPNNTISNPDRKFSSPAGSLSIPTANTENKILTSVSEKESDSKKDA